MIAEGNAANRRTHVRKPLDAEIDLVARDRSHRVRLLDLSCGGARVRAAEKLGEWGDAVTVRLPGKEDRRVLGTIVRVQPDPQGVTFGLRFEPVPADMYKSISGLLDLR